MTKKLTAIILCLLTGLAMVHAQTYDPGNFKPTRNRNVKITETNLPIVFMDLKGQAIADKNEDRQILVRMKIIDNKKGVNYGDTIAHPKQDVDYEGWIALKYRGNSSFSSSEKKPYGIRTLEGPTLPEAGGKKEKVKLLGMGKDNRWVMLAPWSDRSMLRDMLSFELGRPWFDYVPSGRFCELVLDGTYYGVFILCEKVSDGKKRLNLDDIEAPYDDLTGDYQVEIDRDDAPNYKSKYPPVDYYTGREKPGKTIKYQYTHPDDDDLKDLPENVRTALHSEIDKMEDSFTTGYYTDPERGYRKYIDVTSFIDYMLSTEISMNIDGYRLSTNLYKYSETRAAKDKLDPRWKMSLWDFNIAWGNADYYDGERTDLWQYTFNSRSSVPESDTELVPFYWYRMLNDPAFMDEVKARWKEYRESNYSDERLFATIDSLANELTSKGAVDRNQEAWGIIGRKGVWPCPYTANTYEDEISHLKDWIRRRLAFMDKNLLPKEPRHTAAVEVAEGWNSDVIAEERPSSQSTDTSLDKDGNGNVFYSCAVSGTGGLPTDGIIASEAEDGVVYALSPYSGKNALSLRNNGDKGEVVFRNPVNTSMLYVLATSAEGEATVKLTLNYSDGTASEPAVRKIPDWSRRNPDGTEAVTALGRIKRGTDVIEPNYRYSMFDLSVAATPEKPVRSVTIESAGSSIPTFLAFSRTVSGNTVVLDENEAMPKDCYGEKDVILKRTFSAASYNTVALPFGMKAAQIASAFGADAKVYAFSNDTPDGIIYFDRTDETEANVPFLLSVSTDATSFDIPGVEIVEGTPEVKGQAYDYVGNYDGEITLDSGLCFLSSNKFCHSVGKSRLKGYRAYFRPSGTDAAGKELVMCVDGVATYIGGVTLDGVDGDVYNLNGQKVSGTGNGLPKGVYLRNGRKFVVK